MDPKNLEEKKVCFFLGANSPQGFVSRFDQLIEYSNPDSRLYILKGGPGTGKSSLMEQVARYAEQAGYQVERIYCSSDAASLDAVRFPELYTAIADGTAPHVLEPRFPGLTDHFVCLGDCWNEAVLEEQQEEILCCNRKKAEDFEHANRFLSAVGTILNDTRQTAEQAVDQEKLARFLRRLTARELGSGGKNRERGKEQIRFLSAINSGGVTFLENTVSELADQVYRIEDEWGVLSKKILTSLRDSALDSGLQVISCYCPTAPFEKLEHLFLPEKRLCFVTSNRYHPLAVDGADVKVINGRRFLQPESFRKIKKRLYFNRSAVQEMLGEAVRCLQEAKRQHEQLEQCYHKAMDYSGVSRFTECLAQQILRPHSLSDG